MFALDPVLMLWDSIAFVILLYLLYRFALPPILAVLEQRQKEVNRALDLAKKSQEASQAALLENQRKIEQANQIADKIIERANRDGEEECKNLIEKARQEAQGIIQEARSGIAREKEKIIKEIRGEAADLITRAATKVLGRVISEKDDKHLIEESINEFTGF